MYTTYHFNSASELNVDIIKAIKTIFKEKPISIIVEEDFEIPQWQKDEVLKRLEKYKKNPNSGLDFDQVINQIENELG